MLEQRFKVMGKGSAYGIRDHARIVMAIFLLFNAVRTFENEEFAVGLFIPRLQMLPKFDVRAERPLGPRHRPTGDAAGEWRSRSRTPSLPGKRAKESRTSQLTRV